MFMAELRCVFHGLAAEADTEFLVQRKHLHVHMALHHELCGEFPALWENHLGPQAEERVLKALSESR